MNINIIIMYIMNIIIIITYYDDSYYDDDLIRFVSPWGWNMLKPPNCSLGQWDWTPWSAWKRGTRES